MKKKTYKIFGVALVVMLIASMLAFVAPALAAPAFPATANKWVGYGGGGPPTGTSVPAPGAPGGWFYDPTITGVGPIAKDKDGETLYAYVAIGSFYLPDSGDAITFTATTPGGAGARAYIHLLAGGALVTTGGSGTWDPLFSNPSWEGECLTLADGDTVTFTATTTNANGLIAFQNGLPATWTISADTDGDASLTSPAGTIFKSTDSGHSWTTSKAPGAYSGGPVVDMVCSELDSEILYVTDGNYVYKSADGANNFSVLAKENLEYTLEGDCGIPITDLPITCIDVGYNGADDPIVFIGTKHVGHIYVAGHPLFPNDIVGSVYWIAENTYPAEWDDLQLFCYGCCDPTDTGAGGDGLRDGCFDVYAVAASPDFANNNKAYATVTRPTTLFIPANTAETITVTADSTLGATFSYSTPAADLGWAGTCGSSPVTLAAGASCTFTTDGTNAASEVEITVTAGRLDSVVAAGATTVCPATTQVVSTLGTTCAWSFVSELFWNCDTANPFQIRHASRFAFPTDFTDTSTMFIGVTGTSPTGPGGDVYRAVDDGAPSSAIAIDLNVQGFTTGCIGLKHANICSLDMIGSTDDGSLIAGAYDSYDQQPTNVYYSNDGGWTWAASKKDPTGVDRTYVLWFGSSAVAGTRWCDCAFSMSCGDEIGEYWNQISLINTCIDAVRDLTHAPEYIDGASTMYMLTYCDDACGRYGAQPSTSLFRWDGTYWERVFSNFTYETHEIPGDLSSPLVDDALMEWVEVSPDFNTTGCVYLASTDFQMYRTIDTGCSWSALSYPCEPRPSIEAWIVVDEETVLVAGDKGGPTTIYKTDRHGARPWDEYPIATAGNGVDFDLSPNIATDGSVLFGDDKGQVFLSEDIGETWTTSVGATSVTLNTYVQFDPGYGTSGDPGETIFYAAAGSLIVRYNTTVVKAGAIQWEQIGSICRASGIDAQGDTALYVADAGPMGDDGGAPEIAGTLAVRYDCASYETCTCDLDITGSPYAAISGLPCGEPLVVVAYNLYCTSGPGVAGSIIVQGVTSGLTMKITINETLVGTCFACTPEGSAVEVISTDAMLPCAAAAAYCKTGVWRSLNPLAFIPPGVPFANIIEWEMLDDPSTLLSTTSLQHDDSTTWTDDLWLTTSGSSNILWCLDSINYTYVWVWDDPLANPVILASPACGAQLPATNAVTLEWEALDGATLYEIELYQYCPQCPDERMPVPVDDSPDTCAIVTGLNPGTEYFWRVRVALGKPYLSKWSELCSFTTALEKIPELCSPVCGAKDIILTTNFSWTEVPGAASYELQIVAAGADGTADFTGATTYTSDVNALASIPGLEYSIVYYWRVRAVTGSIPGAWAVCIFTTMDEPEEPVEPADVILVPPAQEEITPTWIWVLIGIGAALTVAVVILIVTTRRVP